MAMERTSSGDEGIKNKFFWDLKRLFSQKQEEEVEDDEHLNRDFGNLGLESNKSGAGSDDRSGSNSVGDRDRDRDRSNNISMQYPIRLDAADCSFYLRTGTCMYGRSCKFNHPASRRNLARSTVVSGRIPCKFYLAGTCKYGESCRFDHSKSEAEMSPVQYNVLGLPIRPGEKACAYYMRTAMCDYGASCRFHHPPPIFVEGTEIYNSMFTGELPDGISKFTDGEQAILLSESAQAYFLLPLATDNYQTYVWNGYEVPDSTQGVNTSFAPPAVSVKMADDPPQGPPKREPCDLNDLGLPIRPGKEVCWNYRNLGLCNLGRACLWDHPKNYSFVVPDGSTSASPSRGKTQKTKELNEQGAGTSSSP